MKAAFFCNSDEQISRVYGNGRRERLAKMCDLYPDIVSEATFDAHASALADVEAVFSTWGMWALTAGQLDKLPKLRAMFYAAGSVKPFAAPLLDRHILLCSAWAANAVPVAEFTVAQTLLTMKGYFRNTRDCRTPAGQRDGQPFRGRGVFGETVALLGAGQIGRKVIELLRPFEVRVAVFDPFLSDSDAAALEVEKVSLEEAFARGYVVSNHLAHVPETEGLLNGALFASLRPDATFINTGRGATVNEGELIDVLRRRLDVTALLDVTHSQCPADDSPLYTLPNVQLSSHIAGSLGDEVVRMADYMIAEFEAWVQGRPSYYRVTKDMLATMT